MEFLDRGQNRGQRALGQASVPDLATLRCAHAPRFAGGKRRHVVVEHEALAILALQRVDDLLVLFGAQRGRHHGLRFTAGKKRRSMGSRQDSEPDFDRPHRARIAPVDARLAVQYLASYELGLQIEQDRANLVGVRRGISRLGRLGDQRRGRLRLDLADPLGSRLLAADLVGRPQVRPGQVHDAR